MAAAGLLAFFGFVTLGTVREDGISDQTTIWTVEGLADGFEGLGQVGPPPTPEPVATGTPAPEPVMPDLPEPQEESNTGEVPGTILSDAGIGVPDGAVEGDFFAGYRQAGGVYPEGHVWWVIHCESTWRPITGGYYLGLAQFAPSTWSTVASITGLWDWTSPFHQGYNMGVWAGLSNPGSQWPYCWWWAAARAG